ncbi:TPA: transcription/translation regulatory transformer protein RfaH [Providencia rettgeri]|uniref:transcription/translation regulatory transformer protein RfaH n=1 Tax=Providencia TaxID=586 RepID=UPI0008FAF66B|nr:MULTISPECIES: transcription/translation regulatory transformer protein RfaH [Providencia]APC14183.1 Transcriptional activator rfaH,transcriptional activator RfaH,transcriptional activator RfaH,Transcription termination factor nusG [Providencia rettgeri]HEC8326287.1 transcription/translation regulatory transformer protein RfaH [Providencia rettgeri]
MEKWYLLYCKRDQVLRAIEHLERQGVTVHNPTYKTEKMVRNRRKKVMEPLFPNYLFVKFDYEVIHFSTIGSTRGVNYFVRFGQNPVVVPNEVIATLVVPDFVKEMSDNLPQKGDEVVITDGIFAGIQAIYNEPDGEARSVLLLNILNREVPKVVDNRSFETIK